METYLLKEPRDPKCLPAVILENPHYLSLLAHPLRLRILTMLADRALYPAQIAEKLQIHEQTIYYHIQKLARAGIIEVADTLAVRGTVAKKFRPTALSFALLLKPDWQPFTAISTHPDARLLSAFFDPVIQGRELRGSIVIGSPEPHGPLRASARDGHYAIDLALALGSCVESPRDFSVKLDVDIISNKEMHTNQVLIGGPITNLVMDEINTSLPVRFMKDAPHMLFSERTKMRYSDDSIGFITKIPNPFDKKNALVVIAGVRAVGTKSAVIALTRYTQRVLGNYAGEPTWSAVVKGFDMDGDGKIDSIDILE